MSGPIISSPITIPAAATETNSTPTSSLDYSLTVVPSNNVEYPIGVGAQTAGLLALYDSLLHNDADQTVRAYTATVYGNCQTASFHGYEGLVATLHSYSSIRELILFVHGESGVLEFNYPGSVGKQKTLKQLIELFEGKGPNITDRISFDNCNVGSDPDQLLAFKNYFATPKISAWNYHHIIVRKYLNLTGNETADTIRNMTKIPDQYLVPGAPSPGSVAGQSGRFDILYEWFRLEDNSAEPGLDPNEKIHIPANSAKTITLSSAEALNMKTLKDPAVIYADESIPADKKLEALHDDENHDGVVMDLAQVIIQN